MSKKPETGARPPVSEGRALLIEGLCPTLQPGAGSWKLDEDCPFWMGEICLNTWI